MVFSIKANGQIICAKVMEGKYGQMDLFMKECGVRIWQMVKDASFILGEMYMKGNGSMIKQKEKEFICTKMEHHIQVSGLMINNTGMELKNGQMELSMMVIFLKD